jgi:hypothetical protein
MDQNHPPILKVLEGRTLHKQMHTTNSERAQREKRSATNTNDKERKENTKRT